MSFAGRDPIWSTGAPAGVLGPADFNAPLNNGSALHRDAGGPVLVLPHPVEYDQDGGRWFADIDMGVDGLGPSSPKPNRVQADVQVFTGGVNVGTDVDPQDALVGWTTILKTEGTLGDRLRVDFPAPGANQVRIVVQEFETSPARVSDSGSEVAWPGRLVYADSLLMTP